MPSPRRARRRSPTHAEETSLRPNRAGDPQLLRRGLDRAPRHGRGHDQTLLYTGVRVSELVRIRTADVDLDGCRIRINQGKGAKDRYVPYPAAFKETLALHIDSQRRAGASYMFKSSWEKPYSDRGVRKNPGALCHRRRYRGPDQPPTDFATSCSPGSRPRGSTTPSSSPTPATPPANRWRSTPESRSPTPNTPTTKRSPTTPSKPRTRLQLVTRFLPAPLYVHRAVDSGGILTPSQQLVGFTRVQLTAGQQKTVSVSFPTSELALTPGDIDGTGAPRVQPGNHQVDFGPTGPSAGFTIN